MLALPALLAAGCAARGDVDLLESELRRQEQVQQELSEQLQTTREDLRVARADSEALRSRIAGSGQVALASEQAEVLYKAESLRFNALLTAGTNNDDQPGDEGLSVLLMPVDSSGDLVKLVGEIEIELFDLTREGDKQRLGRWQFTAAQVREHWNRGLFSAGYLFRLDWQEPPVSPDLTLHATLLSPDGRRFDATTQIKVTPPGTTSQTAVDQARRSARRQAPTVVPASFEAPDPARGGPRKPELLPRVGPAEPRRAGHAPTQTSDNWTDDTIPRLR